MLDIVCRNPNNPDRVVDGLLRWHSRQSVLANMKGAGEPSFERDFRPGTDMMREILQGPILAQRMSAHGTGAILSVTKNSTRGRGKPRGEGQDLA